MAMDREGHFLMIYLQEAITTLNAYVTQKQNFKMYKAKIIELQREIDKSTIIEISISISQ